MEKQPLRELLLDAMEAKGFAPDRLCALTGIPANYLEALLKEKRGYLPPFPYIRGHLLKIAEVLELDSANFIALYRAESISTMSGASDHLPGNRFNLPRRSGRIISVVSGLIVILALVVWGSGFLSKPYLNLLNPPSGDAVFVSPTSVIELKGRIDSGDALTVNGQPVAVDETGSFTTEYQLQPELNVLTFNVKRFLGRQLIVTRQVYLTVTSTPELLP